MKTLSLFLVLLCVVALQARHLDRNDNEKIHNEDGLDNIGIAKDNRAGPTRHRRKRWQMNYGYDYPYPPNPYYPDRRDYDRNQDLLPHIYSLVNELYNQLKRPQVPPPPPQIVYVPYVVPYPIPQPSQNCSCNPDPTPEVPVRFPEMEDTNQNWGIVDTNMTPLDDGSDGARPISFEPIKPIRPMMRPAPAVEHGSSQASVQGRNERHIKPMNDNAPEAQEKTPLSTKTAGMCNAAILSCCGNRENRRQCFTNLGCSRTYGKSDVCSRDSITAALNAFKSAYAPA